MSTPTKNTHQGFATPAKPAAASPVAAAAASPAKAASKPVAATPKTAGKKRKTPLEAEGAVDKRSPKVLKPKSEVSPTAADRIVKKAAFAPSIPRGIFAAAMAGVATNAKKTDDSAPSVKKTKSSVPSAPSSVEKAATKKGCPVTESAKKRQERDARRNAPVQAAKAAWKVDRAACELALVNAWPTVVDKRSNAARRGATVLIVTHWRPKDATHANPYHEDDYLKFLSPTQTLISFGEVAHVVCGLAPRRQATDQFVMTDAFLGVWKEVKNAHRIPVTGEQKAAAQKHIHRVIVDYKVDLVVFTSAKVHEAFGIDLKTSKYTFTDSTGQPRTVAAICTHHPNVMWQHRLPTTPKEFVNTFSKVGQFIREVKPGQAFVAEHTKLIASFGAQPTDAELETSWLVYQDVTSRKFNPIDMWKYHFNDEKRFIDPTSLDDTFEEFLAHCHHLVSLTADQLFCAYYDYQDDRPATRDFKERYLGGSLHRHRHGMAEFLMGFQWRNDGIKLPDGFPTPKIKAGHYRLHPTFVEATIAHRLAHRLAESVGVGRAPIDDSTLRRPIDNKPRQKVLSKKKRALQATINAHKVAIPMEEDEDEECMERSAHNGAEDDQKEELKDEKDDQKIDSQYMTHASLDNVTEHIHLRLACSLPPSRVALEIGSELKGRTALVYGAIGLMLAKGS